MEKLKLDAEIRKCRESFCYFCKNYIVFKTKGGEEVSRPKCELCPHNEKRK